MATFFPTDVEQRLRLRTMRMMVQYSYLVLYLPRGTSRDTARQILTDHAEYGHWELARMYLYADACSSWIAGFSRHLDRSFFDLSSRIPPGLRKQRPAHGTA